MKKQIMLSMLYIGMLIPFVVANAESDSSKAKEWLQKNATKDMKKLIINLRRANNVEAMKYKTFGIISSTTPEWEMFKNFPDFVQNYYYEDKFSSLMFEDMDCPLEKFKVNGKVDPEFSDSIKPHIYKEHNKEITAEDIKNFDSDIFKS